MTHSSSAEAIRKGHIMEPGEIGLTRREACPQCYAGIKPHEACLTTAAIAASPEKGATTSR